MYFIHLEKRKERRLIEATPLEKEVASYVACHIL
jgi:hypothetical protein